MNKSSGEQKLYLSLYPNSYGIAYVLSFNAQEIVDFGIRKITPLSTSKFIQNTKKLLEFAQPDVVIIRNPQSKRYRWSEKKEKMILTIKEMALEKGLQVFDYNREQIQGVFSQFGSSNKFGIARKLVDWYPFLQSRMPTFRKMHQAEHYQMGLFDAFALLVTHSYLEE